MPRFTRKDFLEALFQDYFHRREGFILVRTIRTADKKTTNRYFPNTEILAKEIYPEDQNVFFGVCPRESMKPDKSHIRVITTLWAGLDLDSEGYSGKENHFLGHPQAAKAVRSFPLPPSIIIESGYGLHLYWLLKDPLLIRNVQEIETLLSRINHYFQCKSAITVDAMMRLPETVNSKLPSQRSDCFIKYLNHDFRYDVSEFEKINIGGSGSGMTSTFLRHISDPDDAEKNKLESKSIKDTGIDPKKSLPKPVPKNGADHSIGHAGPNSKPKDFIGLEPKEDFSAADFEPVPYEEDNIVVTDDVTESDFSTNQTLIVTAEETSESLADEIAEKIMERLRDELVDKLADEIVDRLAKKFSKNR